MNIKRIFKHLFTTQFQFKRHFPPTTLDAIKQAIKDVEDNHEGEIRFVIENHLDVSQLLADTTAHERAIDIFSTLRVWDTEHNNGILIYLLLADHAVEIIADRGINAKCTPASWNTAITFMQSAFSNNEFKTGALEGIKYLANCLEEHSQYKTRERINELPDEVVNI
ncbi:MAG: TPM domain-containing protein [Pseudomonadota bacterium]